MLAKVIMKRLLYVLRSFVKVLPKAIVVIVTLCAYAAGVKHDGINLVLVFTLLIAALICAYVLSVSNSIRSMDVPLPPKRFTEEDGDGVYSVNNNDIQAMILYVHEIERYIDEKGILIQNHQNDNKMPKT